MPRPPSPPLSTKELLARHPLARLNLIRSREKIGKTRAELGQELGLERPRFFALETGTRNPSLALMRQWAQALGETPTLELLDYLFGEPRPILDGHKPGRRRHRKYTRVKIIADAALSEA